jgi:hypothetical protein
MGKDLTRLLKKDRSSVHPTDMLNFRPKTPINIPDKNNDNEYGSLTDKSSYSEYVWSFISRNRYYQRLVDKIIPGKDLENWENAIDQNLYSQTGIYTLKPYTEEYYEGAPVEWWGIHSFNERLNVVKPVHGKSKAIIDYPKTQAAVIFDIDAILENKTTAIDIQVAIAKKHLYELSKKLGNNSSLSNRSFSKKLLRTQLRVADLLSAPKSLPKIRTDDKPSNTILEVGDVAKYLLKSDLYNNEKNKKLNYSNMDSDRKRVSELACLAWHNIYNMKSLQLLKFDNWDNIKKPV